jgi:hypothetical protein
MAYGCSQGDKGLAAAGCRACEVAKVGSRGVACGVLTGVVLAVCEDHSAVLAHEGVRIHHGLGGHHPVPAKRRAARRVRSVGAREREADTQGP